MDFNFVVGDAQVKLALAKLNKQVATRADVAVNKATMFIQTVIKTRTSKGKDWRGGSFKPYSEGYKKKRLKRGATTTPNLMWSGLMLSNMQPKKTGKLKRKLFFPNQHENRKAAYHDFIGAGKGKVKRPFMSVNSKEWNKAYSIFHKEINKIRI
tara:strand:- start:36 stop:497 length:462 start_codon:yes stop_codon:yes gene_type:complete